MAIDYESKETASKILIVIFIIATIIINLELLIKYIRIPGFLNFPGICARITISLGSIYLALFSYVVLAIIYYRDHYGMPCTVVTTAVVYQAHFLPFVVGYSIVLQGFNLYAGQNFMSSMNPKIKSLTFASLPWFLGLFIVCPLSLAGTNWEYGCHRDFTLSRLIAIIVLCVIIPACAAVLSSIVFYLKTKPFNSGYAMHIHAATIQGQVGCEGAVHQDSAVTHASHTQQQNIDYSQQSQANQSSNYNLQPYPEQCPQQNPPQYHQQNPPQYLQQNPSQYSQQYLPQYPQQIPSQYPQQNPPQNPQDNPLQYPQQNPPQYPQQCPKQNPQQYPQQNPPQYPQQNSPHYPQQNLPQYPQQNPPQYPQQFTQYYPQPSHPQNPTHCPQYQPQDIAMEKKCLVKASIVFFFSVMPLACLALLVMNHTRPSSTLSFHALTITHEIFRWVFLIYPILVPLIWRSERKL